MPEAYQRLQLRAKIETLDHTIAALRRTLTEGRLQPHQVSGHVAWILVHVEARLQAQRQLAAAFPDDDYASRPVPSWPPECELLYLFDACALQVRQFRLRLDDGLEPRQKFELLRPLRRHLAEAAGIARTFQTLYPASPNLSRLRLTSEPTPFELQHPESKVS